MNEARDTSAAVADDAAARERRLGDGFIVRLPAELVAPWDAMDAAEAVLQRELSRAIRHRRPLDEKRAKELGDRVRAAYVAWHKAWDAYRITARERDARERVVLYRQQHPDPLPFHGRAEEGKDTTHER